MTRIVLVGLPGGKWKLFRQPQWMAEVRRDPLSATFSKRYFDVQESAYLKALEQWDHQGAGAGLEAAIATLNQFGAVEIHRS